MPSGKWWVVRNFHPFILRTVNVWSRSFLHTPLKGHGTELLGNHVIARGFFPLGVPSLISAAWLQICHKWSARLFNRHIHLCTTYVLFPFSSIWPFDYLNECVEDSYSWTFFSGIHAQLFFKSDKKHLTSGSKIPPLFQVFICVNKQTDHKKLGTFDCEKKFGISSMSKGQSRLCCEKLTQFLWRNCDNDSRFTACVGIFKS